MKLIPRKFLLLVGFFSFLSTNSYAFYEDVDTTTPYYDEIFVLYEMDKLPQDELFHPEEELTKAEFYKLLLEFTQVELSTAKEQLYTDIPTESEYSNYIQTAVDYKLISNTNSNNFWPEQKMSRHNTLTKVFQNLGIGLNYFYNKDNFPFTDISADSFIAPVAYKAYEMTIFRGDKFKPTAKLTKAEFARVLYKIDEQKNYSYFQSPNHTIEESSNSSLEEAEKYPVLENSYEIIKNNYYYQDQIEEDELIYNAIKGMLTGLDDPYTIFETPLGAEELISSLSGEYIGIGVVIENVNGQLTVVSPLKDSPASKAGLKSKDIILKINELETVNMSLLEASEHIKGEAGTSVKLTIQRGAKRMTISVIREAIVYNYLEHEIIHHNGHDIGYISIMSFAENTHYEMKNAILELQAENPRGYIIDLRNNPGGFIDVALAIANQFSKESIPSVSVQYANGSKSNYVTAGNGLLAEEKIVILINGGSASASEILASFIQDYQIGTIIGTQSFRKGSVQQLVNFSDNSLLKYTSAKWFTPKGISIDKTGVTPDIVVENNNENYDAQLREALNQF